MNIYEKLQTARIELHKVQIKKNQKNEFAGYRYMDLTDFLQNVQSVLFNAGLCPIVSFDNEFATLTLYEFYGIGTIVFTSPLGSAALKGCHQVQNIGAVETYQRKYLYLTAMEISEHDAVDSSPPIEEPPKKPVKEEKKLPYCTEKNFNEKSPAWKNAVESGKISPEQILTTAKTKYQLTEAQEQEVLSWK